MSYYPPNRTTIPQDFYATAPPPPPASMAAVGYDDSYAVSAPHDLPADGPAHSLDVGMPVGSSCLPAQHRPSSGAWSTQDDQTLVAARSQGKNWNTIHLECFPTKTANACRKRHERLMERRGADTCDIRKTEHIAKEYMSMRKEIWQGLAARTGEKWNVVEQKCMSNGLKNLQSYARAHARRERFEMGNAPPSSMQAPLPPQQQQSASLTTGYDDDSGFSEIGLTPVHDTDYSHQPHPSHPSILPPPVMSSTHQHASTPSLHSHHHHHHHHHSITSLASSDPRSPSTSSATGSIGFSSTGPVPPLSAHSNAAFSTGRLGSSGGRHHRPRASSGSVASTYSLPPGPAASAASMMLPSQDYPPSSSPRHRSSHQHRHSTDFQSEYSSYAPYPSRHAYSNSISPTASASLVHQNPYGINSHMGIDAIINRNPEL